MIPIGTGKVLMTFGPYAVIALLGLGIAVQTVRLDALGNDFDKYKLDQQKIQQDIKDKAIEAREKASEENVKAFKLLDAANAKGEALARCIAAGKCNGLRINVPSCPKPTVSTDSVVNGNGGSAVPPTGGVASEEPQVINDCSKVQLRLNNIQAEVRAQPGYLGETK